MKKRIAINGLGRIGRLILRELTNAPDIIVVAANDLTDTITLAHLMKYDSAHGAYPHPVVADSDSLHIGGNSIRIFSEREPENLPWKDLNVDLVLECTGVFTDEAGMSRHIQAGASKVLLSAPAKGKGVPTHVMGVNHQELDPTQSLFSNASCTTNCLAPVLKILNECASIQSAHITTIHAYTADQRLHDAPHRDLRRARAAATNIVPTTTGAGKAVELVYPALKGKLFAFAFRVPVITGSLVDITASTVADVSADAINTAFRSAADHEMKGLIQYQEDPIVSSDIIGNQFSAIFDPALTKVQGSLVKIVAWYDNEAGYAARMVDMSRTILGLPVIMRN